VPATPELALADSCSAVLLPNCQLEGALSMDTVGASSARKMMRE